MLAAHWRRVSLGLLGALCGGALGLLGWWLLLRLGLAPLAIRPRLALVAPAWLGFLVALGAAIGAAGRTMLASAEAAVLPRELEPGSRLLWRLGGLAALLAVGHYHLAYFLLRDPVDLPTFLLAGRALAAGADPYDPAVLASFAGPAFAGSEALPYLYLPLYAVLLRPLAALPLPTAYAAFLLLNAALWPLLVLLCFRLVDPPERLRAPLAGIALVVTASFLPAIQSMNHGSPSLLVAVLVVGGLVAERGGRSRTAGLLLALAVLVKVVPGLVLVYLALRRRWTALGWTGVAAAGLLAVSVAGAGLEPHARWLTEVMPALSVGARTGTWFEPACHPENQALTGVLCRLLGQGSASLRLAASTSSAALVLLALAAVARRRGRDIVPVDVSLVLVTLLLASTITWFHHMTLMLPVALTLLVEAAGRAGFRRPLLGGAALVVLVAVGFEFLLDPWPFVVPNPLCRSVRFLAMALAWGCLAALAAGSRRGGAESSSSPG